MKKNKNVTYVLVFVVISLWVVVFYKLYKSFFSEETLVKATTKTETAKIKVVANEKFVLLANYKDPFFGKNFKDYTGPGKPVNKIIKTKEEKKPEVLIDWSFISYLGLIKNETTKKYIALVSIHGKEFMVSEGDTLEEVTFLKNHKDSIKVLFQDKITYLRKK